jgi:hypothetical protein
MRTFNSNWTMHHRDVQERLVTEGEKVCPDDDLSLTVIVMFDTRRTDGKGVTARR